MSQPLALYRYCDLTGNGLEYFEDMMAHSRTKFSSPLHFNDPFDCRVRYDIRNKREDVVTRYAAYLIRKGIGDLEKAEREVPISTTELERWQEDRIQNISRGLANSGMLCLTTSSDNLVMWTHYAKHHSGICLEFKLRNDSDLEQIDFFAQARAINYTNEAPLINWVLDEMPAIVQKVFFTKALPYSYEEEWRIVYYDKSADVKPIPKGIIAAVIVGVNITPNDKERVIKACSNYDADVAIVQAKLIPVPYSLTLVQEAIV
jgi:Protein of unknown function (DUF2971)